MLSKVVAQSASGTILTLELDDISDGLVLQEINGLDPVKATLSSSSFAGQDGEQFHSARRESRNITMTLGLEPDYVSQSVQDLRRRLYDVFAPKTQVQLTFYFDDDPDFVLTTSGVVEDMQAPLFTKEPTADISIVCYDPDFLLEGSSSLSGNTVSTSATQLVTYDGTTDAGIKLTLNVDRTLTEFTIYQTAPDGSVRSLDFQAPLVTGDVVTLSTVAGNKYATLRRTGTDSSVLYGVSPQANWIALTKGDNHLRVYAVGAGIPYTIEYNTRYGGL